MRPPPPLPAPAPRTAPPLPCWPASLQQAARIPTIPDRASCALQALHEQLQPGELDALVRVSRSWSQQLVRDVTHLSICLPPSFEQVGPAASTLSSGGEAGGGPGGGGAAQRALRRGCGPAVGRHAWAPASNLQQQQEGRVRGCRCNCCWSGCRGATAACMATIFGCRQGATGQTWMSCCGCSRATGCVRRRQACMRCSQAVQIPDSSAVRRQARSQTAALLGSASWCLAACRPRSCPSTASTASTARPWMHPKA